MNIIYFKKVDQPKCGGGHIFRGMLHISRHNNERKKFKNPKKKKYKISLILKKMEKGNQEGGGGVGKRG